MRSKMEISGGERGIVGASSVGCWPHLHCIQWPSLMSTVIASS